jgi:osmotically-inducible protein OsmY
MRLDSEIQEDVEAELKWTPEVDATDVAVKVKDGTAALTGFVHNSFQKYRAERAARRVKGVAAVANDIQVRWLGTVPTDPEIARSAVAILKSDLPSAAEQIRPMVHEGRITLLGEVEWHYQRELAEKLMYRIAGVISVRNSIHINPKAAVEKDIKFRIEAAFQRLADVDAHKIAVEAAGSEITLRGEVRSWAERDQAQSTAWAAPGVTHVANELTVRT